MPSYHPGDAYPATVTRVVDGDTAYVRFEDGIEEKLRFVGVDTPETPENRQHERIEEWEGIDDIEYVLSRGEAASAFARDRLDGEAVTVFFDESEPVRDQHGRLLAYVEYEATGGPTLFNRELVEAGHARVYDSGFSKHDDLWWVERGARAAGRGIWERSDVEALPERRDRRVDDLFVPLASSVRTTAGPVDPSRVPVFAERTAVRHEDGGPADEEIPLVAVDESARLAVVGGLLLDEAYEVAEGYPADTTRFENYVFVTNLVDHLAACGGAVLVAGGNDQFTVDYALSAEDMAHYQRYLEGQGLELLQNNTLTEEFLELGRGLLVTPPRTPMAESQLDRARSFRDDGGAVVLMGGSDAPSAARAHLNAVAEALDSDLRLGGDRILDEASNVGRDPRVLSTARFDRRFPLFDAFTPEGSEGRLSVVGVNADPAGPDAANLADEYVTVANLGDEPLDVTAYTIEDSAGNTFEFPGMTLSAGGRVTIRTGTGTDRTDLHWGRRAPVWNNSGDRVVVRDADGVEVHRYEYTG